MRCWQEQRTPAALKSQLLDPTDGGLIHLIRATFFGYCVHVGVRLALDRVTIQIPFLQQKIPQTVIVITADPKLAMFAARYSLQKTSFGRS
jgi:hypothetical protein